MSVSATLMQRLKVIVNSPQPWQELIDLLNGTSSADSNGAYPSNVFTVDTTLAVAIPELRIYPTADAAVVAGDATGLDYAVNILPNQSVTVNGPLTLTKNITFRCPYGGRSASLLTPAGGLNVAGGTGFGLRFVDLTIGHQGIITDATGLDTLIVDNCRVISLTGKQIIGFAGIVSTSDTQWVGTRFVAIGQNAAIGFGWTGSSWTPGAGFPATATVFGMSANVVNTFLNCDINAEGIADCTLFSRSASTPVVSLKGTSIAVENTGGASAVLFSSASLGVVLRNVAITRSGAGLVNFGTGVASATVGLAWHGADPDDVLLPTGSWHNVAGDVVQVP